MKFSIMFAVIAAFSIDDVYAHWGHVGELAGHGHWVAVGAVVVAGILAGVLGKPKKDEAAGSEDADELPEPEGETA